MFTRGEDKKLSNNFMLHEFVKSQTASREGIDNWPEDEEVVNNLEALCKNILQPVREHMARPININSGYRSFELEKVVCAKSIERWIANGRGTVDEYLARKQHPTGNASDIEINGFSNLELAIWIRDNLEFDQLILEFFDPAKGQNSGWVHVSFNEGNNRKQTLTINSNGTVNGFAGE